MKKLVNRVSENRSYYDDFFRIVMANALRNEISIYPNIKKTVVYDSNNVKGEHMFESSYDEVAFFRGMGYRVAKMSKSQE